MKNVTFGNYDAYLDFDLIRTGMTIGTPTIKKRSVEIEGADGEYDLTEYFGDVNYSNRTLSFSFETPKRQDEFTELYTRILNALHGRKMKVKPSDEIDYYFYGRITVNEWKTDKAIGKIVIDVDAEPYKYRNNPTVVSRVVNGTALITCKNSRKSVVPEITITAETKIVFKTYSETGSLLSTFDYTVTAATYPYTFERPEILLKEGDNVIEATTTGTVTIKYQEGVL